MIELSDLTGRLRSYVSPGEPTYDRRIMHPEREWYLGVTVGCLVVVAGSWWALITYLNYSDLAPEENVVVEPTVRYRANQVAQALTIIDERAETFASLTPAGATPVPEADEPAPDSSATVSAGGDAGAIDATTTAPTASGTPDTATGTASDADSAPQLELESEPDSEPISDGEDPSGPIADDDQPLLIPEPQF